MKNIKNKVSIIIASVMMGWSNTWGQGIRGEWDELKISQDIAGIAPSPGPALISTIGNTTSAIFDKIKMYIFLFLGIVGISSLCAVLVFTYRFFLTKHKLKQLNNTDDEYQTYEARLLHIKSRLKIALIAFIASVILLGILLFIAFRYAKEWLPSVFYGCI